MIMTRVHNSIRFFKRLLAVPFLRKNFLQKTCGLPIQLNLMAVTVQFFYSFMPPPSAMCHIIMVYYAFNLIESDFFERYPKID